MRVCFGARLALLDTIISHTMAIVSTQDMFKQLDTHLANVNNAWASHTARVFSAVGDRIHRAPTHPAPDRQRWLPVSCFLSDALANGPPPHLMRCRAPRLSLSSSSSLALAPPIFSSPQDTQARIFDDRQKLTRPRRAADHRDVPPRHTQASGAAGMTQP